MGVRALAPGDDLDEVGRIYAESWKQAYRDFLPEAYLEKLTFDRWSAMLRADPGSTLALFVQDEMMGAATVCFSREPGREGYGEIVGIYIRPGYTGGGLGRRLMEAALAHLRESGCENVCLWAFSLNTRAERFYEHMGFHPTGRRQHETYGGKSLELCEYARSLTE